MTQKRMLLVAATVLTLVLLAGCGSSDKKESSTTTQADDSTTTAPAVAGSSGNAVSIKGFAFNPEALKVKVGTKVTWTNDDSTDHTATSTEGPASFDSGHLGNGKTFSSTFSKKGTYQYHCDIHNSMTGTIDVS